MAALSVKPVLGESTNVRASKDTQSKTSVAPLLAPKPPATKSVAVHLRVRPMLPDEVARDEQSVFSFLG
jgi:hypothetical protein